MLADRQTNTHRHAHHNTLLRSVQSDKSLTRDHRTGVASGVRRMNEVNARRARLVPGWVIVFGRVYHLGM